MSENPITKRMRWLESENKRLACENRKFRQAAFRAGAMNEPPCFCCGYNGEGYFNPDMHPCAKEHKL